MEITMQDAVLLHCDPTAICMVQRTASVIMNAD